MGDDLAWTAGVSYRDDLNRADASTLGANWRVDRNASPRLVGNKAVMKAQAFGEGRAGCWTSYQGGANAGRLVTDSYRVTAQLIAPGGTVADNNFTGIVCAVADTFGAAMMLYFIVSTATGCALYTQSGLPPASGISTLQTGQTQRAVTSTNIALTDQIELRRTIVTGQSVFTGYRNGVAMSGLSWTDTSNLVASGSTNRKWGFFVEGNTPFSEYRSPGIDWIEAADL
ncbi:DUF7257 domain-containing protein [Nocardia salmonicida]|uniref:DUF7257 domain-containing protein n=1 Tax=Nocardia salmonicida TaxID=53431 RepID=UPI00363ACE67